MVVLCFFFNDTATTEIYTLSLHDALPISVDGKTITPTIIERTKNDKGEEKGIVKFEVSSPESKIKLTMNVEPMGNARVSRSEEHTSELQSRQYLVCRLLLEKKKKFPELFK